MHLVASVRSRRQGQYPPVRFRGSLREGLPVSSYQNTVRPGDVKYRDLNRDGRIDDYDRTYQL